MMEQTTYDISDNKENMRFEVSIDGEKAFLDYRFYQKDIALMHTDVPETLKGRGIGTALAMYAFAYAKKNKLPVMVYCPFVAGFIKKNPEYKQQLDPKYYPNL